VTSQFVIVAGANPTRNGEIMIWNAHTGHPVRTLAFPEDSTEPDIIGQAVSLPRRHLLLAYSIRQQALGIWSTNTWKMLAKIKLGPIGGFEPNDAESQIVATADPANDQEAPE